ncbi:MAG: phosphate acyltransferase, partial [candidate division Zixibacteria bacterium]|nr:phosphate acyltransferase [candidate division Zixibacteria bacterium]
MGSDRGPAVVGQGAIDAAIDAPDTLEITLVGNKTIIEELIRSQHNKPENLRVAHAEAEIQMTDSPSEAVKKPNTSVAVGINLLKSGQIDAFVSASNTGAVMAGSLLTLGRLPGVNRPAIMALFP